MEVRRPVLHSDLQFFLNWGDIFQINFTMYKFILITCTSIFLFSACLGSDRRAKRQAEDSGPTQDPISASLGLVADSNSIRENIVDKFTCEGRAYGYYADVANDCQLFHVCYPVAYPDGQEEMLK